MAETLGSLADKISIIQLKRYHMREQLARRDSNEAHRARVNFSLKILAVQKKDLENEFTALFYAYVSKKAAPKIYRQFKMYNDPVYRFLSHDAKRPFEGRRPSGAAKRRNLAGRTASRGFGSEKETD